MLQAVFPDDRILVVVASVCVLSLSSLTPPVPWAVPPLVLHSINACA